MYNLPLLAFTASVLATPALAQESSRAETAVFAPAVQLQSENGPMRVSRQAGPHHADFDQDGTADMLMGDVMGWVQVAIGRRDQGGAVAYDDPVPVRLADGAALKFSNW